MKIKNYRKPERPKYYILDKNNEVVKDCIQWLKDNKEAWDKLQKLALTKYEEIYLDDYYHKTGKKPKMSVKLLIDVLRWEMLHIQVRDAFSAVLARLLTYMHPQLEDVFTMAQTQTERIVTTRYEYERELFNFQTVLRSV